MDKIIHGECDCCGAQDVRLHKCVVCCIETFACSKCCDYDAAAYGEEEYERRERAAEARHCGGVNEPLLRAALGDNIVDQWATEVIKP